MKLDSIVGLRGNTGVETDPIVGAINGIVKANGSGTISQAIPGTDYIVINEFSALPSPATAGNIIKLTTDKRLYFGLES